MDTQGLAALLLALTREETEVQRELTAALDAPSSLPPAFFPSAVHRLKLLRAKVAELEQAALRGSRAEQEALQVHITRHQSQVSHLSSTLKRLQIATASHVHHQHAQERRALLSSPSPPTPSGAAPNTTHRRKITQATQLRAAKQVTSGLQNLRGMMAGELDKGREALKLIETSSQTLGSVRSEHDKLSSLLLQGKALITKLARRDLTDRILLGLGALLFVLVVTFILKKRLGVSVFGLLFSSPSP